MKELHELLEKIAKKHLDIQTLKSRNRDSLDFHDCGVIAIEAALREAFIAGAEFGRKT